MKAVIPAAGLGTRMLSITKELPKEMLPLFSASNGYGIGVKPLLQIIYEQLYDIGIREFCFIVGRGKRSIEDHFTTDMNYVESLEKSGKSEAAKSLVSFYDKIEKSSIIWINQHNPKGFGHAVLLSKSFINNDDEFLVHAGDTQIISADNSHLLRLQELSRKHHSDAALCVRELKDPRGHGIVIENKIDSSSSWVVDAIEKPSKPPSNVAIMPIYIFSSSIFDSLMRINAGYGNEIQLTDGIKQMIAAGRKVIAVHLNNEDLRLDVGNPASYWEALQLSYKYHSATDK